MRSDDTRWLRRASCRALLLVFVWVSAGLWDVAHALEHARHQHLTEAGEVVFENEGPALTLAARQGHAHSHPPDELPVIGSGKGPELDVPPLPACITAVVIERVRADWTPGMAPVLVAHVSVAVIGPRGPPIS